MSRTPVVCTIIASTAILLASAILTAGPLDPPAGPVAPTYKTLGEIEPRTAINAVNTPGNFSAVYIISQPGSYYLTGDVVNTTSGHSILISADHVTIDLNGFSIRGNFSNISGIAVSGSRTNLAIRNGTIQGHGNYGINLVNASGVLISDIRATGNLTVGVHPGKRAVLTNVVCSGGAYGFHLGSAQECILTNCIASETTSSGFAAGSGRITFVNCIASSTGGSGFVLPAQSQARGCTSTNNSGYGFDVTGIRAVLQDCIAESNLLGGYNVQFSGARMTRCSAGQNGNGATKYSGFLINGQSAELDECAAIGNGLAGFQFSAVKATMRDCLASSNAGRGIHTTVSTAALRVFGSRFEGNTIGAEVGTGSIFEQCAFVSNTGGGIQVNGNGNAIIRGCQFISNGATSLAIGNGTVVEDCVVAGSVGSGITGGTLNIIRRSTFDTNGTAAGNNHPHVSLNGAGNLIEDNYFFNGDSAISITFGGGSIVRRNICNGTANNYGAIVSGNRVANINTSSTLASTNPNDNFSY